MLGTDPTRHSGHKEDSCSCAQTGQLTVRELRSETTGCTSLVHLCFETARLKQLLPDLRERAQL